MVYRFKFSVHHFLLSKGINHFYLQLLIAIFATLFYRCRGSRPEADTGFISALGGRQFKPAKKIFAEVAQLVRAQDS